jgi:hypothetical protein
MDTSPEHNGALVSPTRPASDRVIARSKVRMLQLLQAFEIDDDMDGDVMFRKKKPTKPRVEPYRRN